MASDGAVSGGVVSLSHSRPYRPSDYCRVSPEGIHVQGPEKRQPRTEVLGIHHRHVLLGTMRHARDCRLEIPIQAIFSPRLYPRPSGVARNETDKLRSRGRRRNGRVRILRGQLVLVPDLPNVASQLRGSTRPPPPLALKSPPNSEGNHPNRPCPTFGPSVTANSGLPISGEEFISIQTTIYVST